MADLNHYQVLGVSLDASASVIRTAYRRLALTLHPDRTGDGTTGAFQRVIAAYEVLSDPAKRARYDDQLARLDRRPKPRKPESHSVVLRDVLPRISGPLRSLLAGGVVQRLEGEAFELRLTGDEASRGGYAVISTSPPNQLTHWVAIPAGSVNGDPLTSVIRTGEARSVLQFRIHVSGA